MIVGGHLAGCIGFLLIAHQLYLDQDWMSLIIIGLFFNGFSALSGNLFATMFTKSELMWTGNKYGVSKKATGGYFGGLKGGWDFLGTFIGPLVSPNLYDYIGFEKACIAMSVLQLLLAGIFYIKSDMKIVSFWPRNTNTSPV